jgi:hypothetical protein
MLLFLEFLERRSFVHGQMVGGVALDQVLRLLLRSMDRVFGWTESWSDMPLPKHRIRTSTYLTYPEEVVTTRTG